MHAAHSGAEGKIKAVAERASLASVIAALAAAPGRGPSVARVAGQAVEFISKYYKVSALLCSQLYLCDRMESFNGSAIVSCKYYKARAVPVEWTCMDVCLLAQVAGRSAQERWSGLSATAGGALFARSGGAERGCEGGSVLFFNRQAQFYSTECLCLHAKLIAGGAERGCEGGACGGPGRLAAPQRRHARARPGAHRRWEGCAA